MDKIALGKRIRRERRQMNLTQEQLAEAIGVSTTYIGYIERGERTVTLDKLILISNIFHVSVDYLLTDSVQTSVDSEFSLLKNLWLKAAPAERALILEIAKSVVHCSEYSS